LGRSHEQQLPQPVLHLLCKLNYIYNYRDFYLKFYLNLGLQEEFGRPELFGQRWQANVQEPRSLNYGKMMI